MGGIEAPETPMSQATDTVSEEVKRLIGPEAFSKLSDAVGGLVIDIPGQPKGKQFRLLADLIGDAPARQVVAACGGTPIYIPKGCRQQLKERNVTICQEYDRITREQSGDTAVRRLALLHHLTERRIYQILKRVW